MTGDGLADEWRAARPEAALVHVDSAACARQSFAVIDAVAQHSRHEAEVGGYVAADAATPVLAAGRRAITALTGVEDAEVAFTASATHALHVLLEDWRGSRTVACLPGEYGPNRAVMAWHDFGVTLLPVDEFGRVDVDAAVRVLSADSPALLHITPLASHRGVVQPAAELTAAAHDLGMSVIVDAAQAFAHVDCSRIGADAMYSTSRKWAAGPRGVGMLATTTDFLSEETSSRLSRAEASVANQVGLTVALGEHLAAGPAEVRARLAEVGASTRTALAELRGWQVIEPVDEPSAITTLYPPDGVDPEHVRATLIADHGIVTTYLNVERAPFEMTRPALRVAPHVDVTAEDLEAVVAALAAVS